MSGPVKQFDAKKLMQRLLPVAGALVPAARRSDWVKEWQAELWHLRHESQGLRPRQSGRSEFLLSLSLAYGLIADATWLRQDWLQEKAKGSAAACLAMLSVWSLLLAGVELTIAGSWPAFAQVLISHFFGGFIFVSIPAIVASVSIYPLRPLRWDQTQLRGGRGLSSRARWYLFLVAKVGLTLLLGFLVSLVATAPVRILVGRLSDWAELFMFSVVVTTGLRWALLNQEQRCQKCLRLLGQPRRVGAPSRNFLEWNGTQLECLDGHGRLHVPEMQGSWCWYDQWVEREAGWSSLFGS